MCRELPVYDCRTYVTESGQVRARVGVTATGAGQGQSNGAGQSWEVIFAPMQCSSGHAELNSVAVKYRDDIPPKRWSSIKVLTRPNVEQQSK